MEDIKIEIDEGSGFCFGVVTAIEKAEVALASDAELYCLGDIVHNSDEVSRLAAKGMRTITHQQLNSLHGARVLLRAHGEPPSTYDVARENSISIIDATCPVVLRLQQRIKQSYREGNEIGRQIVIYGKPGHAEVNGLVGQTDGNAIVVQGIDDLHKIDFTKDIDLYSQTTMSLSGFKTMIDEISRRVQPGVTFRSFDTICRQVANRVDSLRAFASAHDLVFFVSGRKSSNGKFLFSECHAVNPATRLISDENDIEPGLTQGVKSIGICGATSTPRWLMERVRDYLHKLVNAATVVVLLMLVTACGSDGDSAGSDGEEIAARNHLYEHVDLIARQYVDRLLALPAEGMEVEAQLMDISSRSEALKQQGDTMLALYFRQQVEEQLRKRNPERANAILGHLPYTAFDM